MHMYRQSACRGHGRVGWRKLLGLVVSRTVFKLLFSNYYKYQETPGLLKIFYESFLFSSLQGPCAVRFLFFHNTELEDLPEIRYSKNALSAS